MRWFRETFKYTLRVETVGYNEILYESYERSVGGKFSSCKLRMGNTNRNSHSHVQAGLVFWLWLGRRPKCEIRSIIIAQRRRRRRHRLTVVDDECAYAYSSAKIIIISTIIRGFINRMWEVKCELQSSYSGKWEHANSSKRKTLQQHEHEYMIRIEFTFFSKYSYS